MSSMFPYIHGFSENEQERLRRQARFGENSVYKDVDFSNCNNLLEVGCGVGAQSEILLRRFPNVQLTGIDFNQNQILEAKNYLDKYQDFKGRYDLHQMDATDMSFNSSSFDGAYICWMLEHVPEPLQVLSETRRVLKAGAKIYVTEVMNSSFFLDPYSPNIWKYWMAFNDYQYDGAGDPFIGAKLGNLLSQIGFQDVHTNIKTWLYDNRTPQKRSEIIAFWQELLMSAETQLIEANYIDKETTNNAWKEMKKVAKDPNAIFMFSFMQAEATSR